MFLSNIKNILLYYDYQPLLFFWVVSDIFNNMFLWTSYGYWCDLGQANTYFLYIAFFIASIFILCCINNLKRLSTAVTIYLLIYLYSTIRYLLNIYGGDVGFEVMDFKNLFITVWYFVLWAWILVKLKNEHLHKKIKNGR